MRRLLLTILALGACQSGPPPAERGSSDPAVVMLRITNSDGEDGHCTGVVVAPHLVLTAAHCVALQTVGAHPDISLYLGGDADDPVRARRRAYKAEVAATTYDKRFDVIRLAAGHDLGLVMSRTPLPVAPLAVSSAALPQRISEARLVGYGIASPAAAEAGDKGGVRRALPLRVHGVTERFIELEDSVPRPCAGDSGGAVLARLNEGGPEVVIGLLSYGDTGCRRPPLVTNLATYAAYLRDFIARDAISDQSAP